jgi:hypothetical protein
MAAPHDGSSFGGCGPTSDAVGGKTDTANEHPPWLKAMQNGAIGEARSWAFLLDRFGVLERSVDIDGTDLAGTCSTVRRRGSAWCR